MDKKGQLEQLAADLLLKQHFDCLALGVVDFSTNDFFSFELCPAGSYFDLASVTKPMTLALAYSMNPSQFSGDMQLLLEHRAGLPAWGRLSHGKWREQILSYSIKESETLYSDFSALRTMLEWEKKTGKSLYSYCGEIWDPEVLSWIDLANNMNAFSPMTGTRAGEEISGQVHDDNAFYLRERISHAGLFGTVAGVCRSLLNWQESFDLAGQMKVSIKNSNKDQRFVCGWDRALDSDNTLAGKGCGAFTFGHLGFTGTSVWIDPERLLGHVILTNATKHYWYDKTGLNKLRRQLGEQVWQL